MSTEADLYNAAQRNGGYINADHLTAAAKLIQTHCGLVVDGKFGPDTRAAVLRWANPAPVNTAAPPVLTIIGGRFHSGGVTQMPIDKTWYGGKMDGFPTAIVWHYTATGPGTGKAMAMNRKDPFRKGVDRAASWHLTIDTDGSIIQMVPLNCKAWHAGSTTAKKIPGLTWANDCSVGIELVSVNGASFTDAQIASAKAVTHALVRTYGIKREHALIAHGDLDPGRRSDPGPLWMKTIGPAVVDYAYA